MYFFDFRTFLCLVVFVAFGVLVAQWVGSGPASVLSVVVSPFLGLWIAMMWERQRKQRR